MDGNRRPRRRHGRWRELLKSLLIVLLSLSAVFLTVQVLSEGSRQSLPALLDGLLQPEQGQGSAGTNPFFPSDAAHPARIAVYDGSERFAVQYDGDQTDQIFSSVSILLSEALASAGTPAAISEAQWQEALCSPGVWFDFWGSIPLDVLYAWLGEGGSNPALTDTARQMIVALDEAAGVRLYYHNESDGMYYACSTSVVYSGHMDSLISGYGSNGIRFVFELEDSDYALLSPYVLISSSQLSPPVYLASNPLFTPDSSIADALPDALHFTAQSEGYPTSGGGITYREGREVLQIGGDGVVEYHASDNEPSRYPVDTSSSTQIVEATYALAAATVGRACGQARLYLFGIEEAEDGIYVRYGYLLNGTPVALSQGAAASFLIQDGQITQYVLRFRNYEEAGTTSPVLRERLAAAALGELSPDGGELILCYTDSGGEEVRAGWMAR